MKLQYAVVYEQMPNNYSAYAPEAPGCIGTADTWQEIQDMTREALALYLEALLEAGEPLPEPKMSLEEAMTFHCRAIAESKAKFPVEPGDSIPTLSTTFGMVKIEVGPLQSVAQV